MNNRSANENFCHRRAARRPRCQRSDHAHIWLSHCAFLHLVSDEAAPALLVRCTEAF